MNLRFGSKAVVAVIAVVLILAVGFAQPRPSSHKRAEKKRKHLDGQYWIKTLNLTHHVEGGAFKEVYRSSELIEKLPARYGVNATRVFGTNIYFLLMANEKSLFHRLQSDEIWNHVDGDPLTILIINKDTGVLEERNLGKFENHHFTTVVPAGNVFGARLKDPSKGGYALVTATVCPGFEYADFELPTRDQLLKLYPQHQKEIVELTAV